MTENVEYTFTATKLQFGPPYCNICGKYGLKLVYEYSHKYEYNLIEIGRLDVCQDNEICVRKAKLKIFL